MSTGPRWDGAGANYFDSQKNPRRSGVDESGPDLDGDRFGSDVSLHDHNRDGRLDLTIRASGENDGAGAITTLRGSGRGFTTIGAHTFGLAILGDAHPAGARFGAPQQEMRV